MPLCSNVLGKSVRHRLRGDVHRHRARACARTPPSTAPPRPRRRSAGSTGSASADRTPVPSHDLLERQPVAEQRVRIVRRVLARLHGDLAEGLGLRAVLAHVLARRRRRTAAPSARRPGPRPGTCRATSKKRCRSASGRSVQVSPSAPGSICSKPRRQHAVGETAGDGLSREVHRARAGRAVVVDVEHRDAGHAHRVDRALAPQVESPYT